MASSSSTTLDDFAALNAELAALVRARIPLEPELRRLAGQLPNGAGALADRLSPRMEGGASLAEAMRAEGDNLPEVYRAVVVAGLASGDPAGALEDVVASARRVASLRRTTGMALLVPMAVVVLASLLLLFLFRVTFDDMEWISPKRLAPFQAWINAPWVGWLLGVVIPVLAIVVPIVWWIASSRVRSMSKPRWWQMGWIPGARELQRLNAAATMSELLRMATKAGLPLDESLRLAAGSVGNRTYRQAALALADKVTSGVLLAGTLDARTNLLIERLPPLVQVALRHEGHRGMVIATLDRAAKSYAARADMQHEALTELVPAAMTIGVAGTVVAVYSIGLMWSYVTMLHTMADAMWK